MHRPRAAQARKARATRSYGLVGAPRSSVGGVGPTCRGRDAPRAARRPARRRRRGSDPALCRTTDAANAGRSPRRNAVGRDAGSSAGSGGPRSSGGASSGSQAGPLGGARATTAAGAAATSAARPAGSRRSAMPQGRPHRRRTGPPGRAAGSALDPQVQGPPRRVGRRERDAEPARHRRYSASAEDRAYHARPGTRRSCRRVDCRCRPASPEAAREVEHGVGEARSGAVATPAATWPEPSLTCRIPVFTFG
jgi:hypothetical protein